MACKHEIIFMALCFSVVLHYPQPAFSQTGDYGDNLPCTRYGDQGEKNKDCCIQKGSKCVSCDYGHGLVNGKCKECKDKNCAVCDGDIKACLQYKSSDYDCIVEDNGRCANCGPGYRMSYDQVQCQKCIPDGCDACWTSLFSCGKCSLFHRKRDDNTCERCTDNNCARCDQDKDVCTDCYSYNPEDDPELPAKDPPNKIYRFGLKDGKCVRCREGEDYCDQENSDKYGPSCASGYYASSGRCIKCAPECQSCNNGTSCTICGKGYYTRDGSSECIPCITANAEYCDQKGIVTSCKNGFFLDSKSKICRKRTLVENCSAYNSESDACIGCENEYGFDKKSGTCKKCKDGCRSCSYNVDECNVCNRGYGNSENGECKKCPKNANDCTKDKVFCRPGYFADNKKNKCVRCKDKRCKSCPDSASKCLVCGEKKTRDQVTFYSPNYATGKCVRCPANMQFCAKGRYICEPGYRLKNKKCVAKD